jgi:hypothetical protein
MSTEIPLIGGQYYHIYNRGNNGENLFIEERNYQYFFNLYIRYIYPIANTYAYCLMRNHFHLLVRMKPVEDLTGFQNLSGIGTPDAYLTGFQNLSGIGTPDAYLTGFQNLSGIGTPDAYLSGIGMPNYSKPFSNLFNAYTKTINKTYKRTGSLFQRPFKRILVDSDIYLMHLVNYIHRNPQKHGFTNDFRAYPYSSYQSIYKQKNSRIEGQQVMDWFGNPKSFAKYHEQSDEK